MLGRVGNFAFSLASVLVCYPACADLAAASEPMERLHLLVPGSAGGGWDTTARGVGGALMASGLVARVSYENMSGAGGAKGVAHMIESRAQNQNVLMVNSTPIVARTLMPVFQQSWRELTPVAAIIGDYGILAVRADSPFLTLNDLRSVLEAQPRSLKFAGGSNRGGLDHLIAARLFQTAGLPVQDLRYVAYDAGGKALLALLSGEAPVMSATVGDAMPLVLSGEVRLLGIASPERLTELPEVPTFTEQGYSMTFVNWRGFFAVPGLPAGKRSDFVQLLLRMSKTEEWEKTRARHGWVNNFIAGADFVRYLEQQEKITGALMRELGFIQ